MAPPRGLTMWLALAVAAVGASDKPRPGDACVVVVDRAPLKSRGRTIARLAKGTQVSVLKVSKRSARVEAQVDGKAKQGTMRLSHLRVAPADPASLASHPAAAGQWPQFRGPNRDGKSTETGLLRKWPKRGPKRVWTARGCGVGWASVAVADGRIHTAGSIGQATAVVAFDLDGKRLWQADIGRAYSASYPGARSTPTVDDGRVYALSPFGDVACLDAQTGRKLWAINLCQAFGGRRPTWAFAESLLVDGDRLICCPGGPSAGVVALDKRTGKRVWACGQAAGGAAYASPIAFDFAGRRHIVAMTGNAAVGIDAATGAFLWRHERPTAHRANVPTPIHHNGHVFLASGYGQGAELLKLRVHGARVTATPMWKNAMFDNHLGGVVLVNGYFYGCDANGNWMCLDFATGRATYRVPGVRVGSVIYADGHLYCLAQDRGVVAMVQAVPKRYKAISAFAVPRANAQVWAHPAIAGGRLYIRYLDFLHAFDIKEP